MTETNRANDHWLVRTSMNEILGPLSREALIAQIREGKLGPQDEICKADSYWIYLDERDEVKRQLGIDMPRSSRGGQDDTETEIETDAMTQELKMPPPGDEIDLPELIPAGGASGETEEGTKVLTRGSRRSE